MSSQAADNSSSLPGPLGFSAKWEADRLGVAVSLLCAVHCMVTPFILLLLPALGEAWSHPAAHWGMALIIVPIAVIMTLKGHKRHGRTWILVTCSLGVLFILGGATAPHIQHMMAESAAAAASGHEGVAHTGNCCPTVEVTASGSTQFQFTVGSILTTLGGLLLIATHIGNLRRCACCSSHKHDHH